jgi:acyl-CoA synthetase (AMP-forming)/AMP-acid ligase II
MDGTTYSVYCSVAAPSEEGREPEMTDSEPWAYHADGTPVLSLADIIRKRAAATPAGIALSRAGQSATFADIDARSSRAAAALRAAGAAPGGRVVFIGASGPTFAEVMYGTAKCGAIFAPVNSRLAEPEIMGILADAEPSVVVADHDYAWVAKRAAGLGFPCSVLLAGGPCPAGDAAGGSYEARLDAAPAVGPGVVTAPDDTALILYTSGTTGLPKGVELTGRNLGCALRELHAGIDLGVRSVCAAPIPFFHISGLGLLLAANLNGGQILLDQVTDPPDLLRFLVGRRVSHAAVVPTVLQRLLALPESRTADWSALSHVVYGASPIPLPVLREAVEVIGCSFVQSYGLTESTGGFTLLGPADHVPDEAFAHRLLSAGRPMAGARVRVVDPVTGEDRPAGERGEVLVSGSRVMKGYWRKPAQTAELMLPGGWLRTGDGGSFDADGYLYLHDRLKDMLISGGENVYPAEVESVMTGHPAVAEVAVVGVPSARWGESPYAAVVLRPGALVTEEELIAWTRDRLAHFKCPVGVSFVTALDRTASGKLRKHVIRAAVLPRVVPGEQVAR